MIEWDDWEALKGTLSGVTITLSAAVQQHNEVTIVLNTKQPQNVAEDVGGYSDMPPVGSSGLSTIFVEVSLTWTFQQRSARGALASSSLCNLRHVNCAGVLGLYEEPWLDNYARMLRLIPIAGPLKTLMCLPGVVT
jgi:hypothetical protein